MVKSLIKRPLRNIMLQLKMMARDFHGGPVVKSLPRSAGDVGSIPAGGTKIPCAIKQVSLRTATEDPVCRH